MKKHYERAVSPRISLLIGAIGAFVFFGILGGWFTFGDTTLQVATPPAEQIIGE